MTFPVVEHVVVPSFCTLQQLKMEASCTAIMCTSHIQNLWCRAAPSQGMYCHLMQIEISDSNLISHLCGVLTYYEVTFLDVAARNGVDVGLPARVHERVGGIQEWRDACLRASGLCGQCGH